MFFQEFQEEAAGETNYVGKLQEIAIKRKWAPPHYDEAGFHGKLHERIFRIRCNLNGATATGYGPKKKAAKQQAAQQLLEEIDLLEKELLVEEPVCKKQKHE